LQLLLGLTFRGEIENFYVHRGLEASIYNGLIPNETDEDTLYGQEVYTSYSDAIKEVRDILSCLATAAFYDDRIGAKSEKNDFVKMLAWAMAETRLANNQKGSCLPGVISRLMLVWNHHPDHAFHLPVTRAERIQDLLSEEIRWQFTQYFPSERPNALLLVNSIISWQLENKQSLLQGDPVNGLSEQSFIYGNELLEARHAFIKFILDDLSNILERLNGRLRNEFSARPGTPISLTKTEARVLLIGTIKQLDINGFSDFVIDYYKRMYPSNTKALISCSCAHSPTFFLCITP
jgi:hypothetical protein